MASEQDKAAIDRDTCWCFGCDEEPTRRLNSGPKASYSPEVCDSCAERLLQNKAWRKHND